MVQILPEERNQWAEAAGGFGKGLAEGYVNASDEAAVRQSIMSLGENPKPRDILNALTNTKTYRPEAKQQALKNYLGVAEYETLQQKVKNDQIVAAEQARHNAEQEKIGHGRNAATLARAAATEGKKTQASQPIDPDQLRRIQQVEETPAFNKATIPEKERMLRNAGVSKENTESVSKGWVEGGKPAQARQEVLTRKQAESDVAFVDDQVAKIPSIMARQQTLDEANTLNEQGVTGHLWDQTMQRIGLLAYTNEGFRVFTSIAKDAVKNQNIKNVIGSQISQMEFSFFRDATINPAFSKEANRQIIKKEKLALRYEKLYADITKKTVEANQGIIPEAIQSKVNDEFARQSEKISNQVKAAALDFQAIQNVPAGHTLMYDKKRRPLHIPSNEVEKYSKPPYEATLS